MEISFDKEYLRQLYEEGMTVDKKHRFQPHIIARYQLRIKVLEQVRGIEELLAINSLHYEVLKGDKAGISSDHFHRVAARSGFRDRCRTADAYAVGLQHAADPK